MLFNNVMFNGPLKALTYESISLRISRTISIREVSERSHVGRSYKKGGISAWYLDLSSLRTKKTLKNVSRTTDTRIYF